MSDYPAITVCIPTYSTPELNRHPNLHATVARLQQNIRYQGEVRYLVSQQGVPTPDGFFADLVTRVSVISSPGGGFGANLNNLLHIADTDLIFQLDDDIELLQPLDLSAHARKLTEDETCGWIRLMWIGHHRYTARLCGGEFPTADPRSGLDGHYWRIDWNCIEHYIPSCRPHLKHRRFHTFFGYYPEGVGSGEVENGFCQLCKNKWAVERTGAPSVLVPLIGVLPDEAWLHTGVQRWRSFGA